MVGSTTVYIGYDSPYPEAYQACANSIRRNSNIEIKPLILQDLKYLLPSKNDGTTEFTYTRFLVPHLNNYSDYAIFCDSDFIFLNNIEELLDEIDITKPVSVVQHKDYTPKSNIKMDNKQQTSYPRKNWSSLIFWNCSHKLNKNFLTPGLVNAYSPSTLHRFSWIPDNQIGNIDKAWNWLIGYYKGTPKALHYTDGGPWLEEYKDCEYSSKWHECINI